MKELKDLEALRKEEFQVSAPEIVVETVSTDVTITESSDGMTRVFVYGESDAVHEIAEGIEISNNGSRIQVSVDKGMRGFRRLSFLRSVSINVVVEVPGESRLEIKTVSGEIEIHASMVSVEATSVSGEITILKNPRGRCSARTVSGDIDAHAFSACQFTLKSISGDITVHVATGLEVDVDGTSISGDLGSEIPLNNAEQGTATSSEIVSIHSATVSGDFSLSRA